MDIPSLRFVGVRACRSCRELPSPAAGVATTYLYLPVYEWAASRASTLLAARPGSAAHSARTRRPRANSDVATRPSTTVGIRRDRRVQPSRPSLALVRAVLIVGADLILLSVAALRLLYENRRSAPVRRSSSCCLCLSAGAERAVRRACARASIRQVSARCSCGSVATYSCCDFEPSERSPVPATVGTLAPEAVTR